METLTDSQMSSAWQQQQQPIPKTSKIEEGIKNRISFDASKGGIAAPRPHNETDDDGEYMKEETLTFPESTHSLLFTEGMLSPGFAFALAIVGISYATLVLALLNNLNQGSSSNPYNIPVQVGWAVRGAQYLALPIGLIMEEEIPEALFLLRVISRDVLRKKFPKIPFWRFVFSALVRLAMGYIILANMQLIIIQSNDVLEIFYDILALQFVQQIDDVAFHLTKKGTFGRHLKLAANRKCFLAEFEKQPFLSRKKMNFFVRSIFFLNFFCLLGGLITVSVRQNNGFYQCQSISVTFGDQIWENALVTTSSTGQTEESVLIYSYFNGVYEYEGNFNGYPVYREQNKFDHTPYQSKTGAVIKYCPEEEAWVFAHENIRKSGDSDESDCPWLLRSQVTSEFDLVEVPNEWTVWTGIIENGAQVSIFCNECGGEADCNYHGVCFNKKCLCSPDGGWSGPRCEHRKPCETIIGDSSDKWAQVFLKEDVPFRSYGRPVYTFLQPDWNAEYNPAALVYSGSRWFSTIWNNFKDTDVNFWVSHAREYHAFWDKIYTDRTTFVSDPSDESTPVGVDFYEIVGRGERYGPFGDLEPVQSPPGHGFFECTNDTFSLVLT